MKYLTPQEIRGCLSAVNYWHPDMIIDLFMHRYEGYGRVCLAITFTVPNSYKQGERQTQCVNVPVPPICNPEHFYDWLKWRLETIALHEVNEMFWVDGLVHLDPHSESYWEARQ